MKRKDIALTANKIAELSYEKMVDNDRGWLCKKRIVISPKIDSISLIRTFAWNFNV